MNYQQAEILGLKTVAYMASHEDILTEYIRLTGITTGQLKNSAADPEILGSILDYFLQHEKRLIAFCQAGDIAPELIARARQLFPGGDVIADSI
ncbi:MAG: DUF3572 domain-containing protein [Alphaproteobacteria bacterium]|nr:DUF3572 domain-containing protein [Alphaproteobacteria bacterium]